MVRSELASARLVPVWLGLRSDQSRRLPADGDQFVELLLTGRDTVYARMFTRSSLVRFCTTGFIRSDQSPLRVPCFMSHICRASMLGERPAIGGTGPIPSRSAP